MFFVPGYQAKNARLGGLPLNRHSTFTSGVPRGYDGPVTLVARLDERNRSVRRALMPLKGHHVAVDPRGHQAFFSALDGAQMVRFDPRSLAVLNVIEPHAPDFVGGGHAAWMQGGRLLVTTERRPYMRFSGSVADHRGRVVIRDGDSMRPVEVYESHGVAPHDLTLIESEGLVAVANYGTTWQDDAALEDEQPFRHVEPRLTLIDLGSGRLVDHFAPAANAYDIRHLAARDHEHLFAVGADYRPEAKVAPLIARDSRSTITDTSETPGMAYGPAPLFAIRRSADGMQSTALMPGDPLDFRQGQTVAYDALYDEVIATFASSHTIAVIDARTFELKRVFRTDHFGLVFPRGIALHPDGRHYVISGSWAGLYYFARGKHEVNKAATWNEVFFHHSHITAERSEHA